MGVQVNKVWQRQPEEAGGSLDTILESTDDAIVGTTPYGVIASWNPGAQKLYGYSAQEAIGHSILILSDQPEETPRIFERIKREERLDHYETANLCKNGTRPEVSICIAVNPSAVLA